MAAAVVLAAGTALGHGMIPRDAPVSRLVANLEQYIKEHPEDALGYYRLGRVHTMALERKEEFVIAFEQGNSVRPAEGSWAKRDSGRNPQATKSTPEELKIHLTEAIKNLSKAIEIDPTDGRFRLTLACALEAGDALKGQVDVWPLVSVAGARGAAADPEAGMEEYYHKQVQSLSDRPEEIDKFIDQLRENHWAAGRRDLVMRAAYGLKDEPKHKAAIERLRQADWHEQIEEQFFIALCYALPVNGKAAEKPIWGGMEDWTSYEAAKNFVRIVEARTPRPSDQIRLKVAKEAIKAFDSLPRPNAITPIVLSVEGRPLSELVSDKPVEFDLDGTGRQQCWTWLRPEAGILVWDPEGTGRITSGRQLFGSVSWWVFFENGYQALDALDDNRDGELTGKELFGLAVWFDRDGDGTSDTGEVVPLGAIGVAALSARATGFEGKAPMNNSGLRLADGRVLPTYDWIAEPAPEPSLGSPTRTLLVTAAGFLGFTGLVCLRRRT